MKTPEEDKFTLKLTAWDRDLLKSNDLICGWELDITDLVDDCKLTGQPRHLTKGYWDTSIGKRIKKRMGCEEDGPDPVTFVTSESESSLDFPIKMKTKSETFPDHKGEILIYFDLRVVPKEFSEDNKVGNAREEPNQEPFLPPPTGRFKLSLNPFTMLN